MIFRTISRVFSRIFGAFRRFMLGRRGMDTLGLILVCTYFLLTGTASLLLRMPRTFLVLQTLALLVFVYFAYRFFSKSYIKREREDQWAKARVASVKKAFRLWKNRRRDRKTHRYFKCPACKNALRVPKGRGNITITCPVCREQIKRRT